LLGSAPQPELVEETPAPYGNMTQTNQPPVFPARFGTIDGMFGHHALILPPFIVEARDIDEIVSRLGEAIDAALAA
jgi:hypothetical protein